MKKTIVFTLVMGLLIASTNLFAGSNPRGHKYYVKHSKHHKTHKVHKHHGILDETYN